MNRDDIAQDVKVWLMVLLTLVFVVLYVLAISGLMHAPPDDKLLLRLEPIIAVIIGYFFGRVPSVANEKSLAQRAKAAEARVAPALEARLEDLRKVLAGDAPPDESMRSPGPGARGAKARVELDEPAVRQRLAAAMRILDREA